MTLNKVKAEIEAELQITINYKEFLNTYYFTNEYLDQIDIKMCNCGKQYLNRQDFEAIILDILLSYKERSDIIEVVTGIFAKSFINK
jgi:hypothetical protein